jgi:hypothetical protein
MTRAILVLLVLAACGGDEEGGGSAPPPPPPKPAQPQPGQPGSKKQLAVYPKIEDRVPADERPTIRHQFRERDFLSDPAGNENRDPFRSYVVAQPGVLNDKAGLPQDITDKCTKKQMVASNYSLRDLRLVGIVSRGPRRFALFQDSADLGNIVHRGDCLGKEKAIVKDIGAGFVTLSIETDQVLGQPPRPPEERSIPLYPEELDLSEPDADDPDRRKQPGRIAPPPTTPPPPPTAPPEAP